MSKITFRADDDLVERLDAFEASKSEVMRDALRAYLDGTGREAGGRGADAPAGGDDPGVADAPVDDALRRRVDTLVADRLDALLADRLDASPACRPPTASAPAPEVNLSVTVEGASDAASVEAASTADAASNARGSAADDGRADPDGVDDPGASDAPSRTDEHAGGAATTDCAQCGESLSDDHVYCPNCGEKASRRLFCDCGDEVRSDWAFCPGCGRRTPAADVLDGGKPGYDDA
ncbi:double zinc ribbon domain-containing protein [Candidatus Halobonum tyrrellensis]|uniref:Uncharacterized protein n=1 Tax=Candidatus Halobonum tyrrellensis G22 TaxID=1324957 RepID=V4IYC7_9EURY|nr:zinc ribbon domain-containing protein [Candidatus Halobonum tyrrellensis]ESP88152.1 hypothetical protein K933_10692 [Candidatus Halobonum tyrrellensis G22]